MTQLAREHVIGQTSQPWLAELRETGSSRFGQKGYPSRRDEEWRFTNVDPIARTGFVPAPRIKSAAAVDAAEHFSLASNSSCGSSCEIAFVNGYYAPQLSKLCNVPRGAKVQSLHDALSANSLGLKECLATLADVKANPFVALNTAGIDDGAFIYLSRGTSVERPIHLLFITAPTDEPIVTHPRVLVIAEENVHATIVESYVGASEGVYLTNAVVEIIAAAGSRIDHCKLQQESNLAYHVSTMQVELARSAQFVAHSAMLGAKLTRNDVNVVLSGEGADATLNGLVLLDESRHCDNHTLLDHAAASCYSHELYKHVLAGKSTGVFKGKILVRPDSQKTNSKQTSKTLLVSDEATMNAMPALEIYADDVKCTHGSTLGPVDEEQVFYLRSRGVSQEAARHLLTYAFAADITRRIRVESVRARIENFMAARHGLPLDLRISDLGTHDEAVVNN